VTTLIAGAGNDVVSLTSGATQPYYFDGGIGSDTLIYSAAFFASAISINLTTGSLSGAVGGQVLNIETISGIGGSVSKNDVIIGNNEANAFVLPVISGSSSTLTVWGSVPTTVTSPDIEQGDALILGTGTAATTVNLNITTSGVQGYGTLVQGTSNASLYGINIVSITGSGATTITGANIATESETFIGGSGADIMIGNLGYNVYRGGAGADRFTLGAGTDVLNYIDGTALVVVTLTSTTSGTATGGAGTDSWTGGAVETIIGSNFNDTLQGFAGATVTFDGGLGNDRINGVTTTANSGVIYDSATAAVTVNLTTGTALGGAGTDTLLSIMHLSGGFYNDTLTGTTGNNSIYGGQGNDLIFATTGTDTYNGGAGADTVSYASLVAAVTANLDTGSATGGSTDILISIENVIGTSLADTITGDLHINTIDGGTGNDVINAGSGDDTVFGGNGVDTIDGSFHNDVLYGGTGSNVLGLSADTLIGGDGNDILHFDNLGTTIIGGRLGGSDNGFDVMQLLGGIDPDIHSLLVANPAQFQGIEMIQTAVDSGVNSLNINIADVLAMSTFTDTLIIFSGSNDIIDSTDHWTFTGTVVTDTTYNVYTAGGATLYVNPDPTQTGLL
jgi:Ca2+-binding RTX toxin-like protein